MPCQISMKKSYQYSAHGISQLSYVWLGWSGIFLCHSYVTLANIFVSFASHITLDNISVSFLRLISHWRIFLCHPRLIRRWPASADWHIDKSLGTNTLPTPPTLYSPVSSQLFECTEASQWVHVQSLYSDVAKMKILSLRGADGRCVSNVKSHISACYCKTFHKT